jgi:hypothetical protein
MDYATAKEVRGTSLRTMITDKLLSGEKISSSIGSSISDKFKARATGIKEKFDPLNIARVVTGGGSLAPALLGRLMGRKKSDIEYFSGKSSTTATKLNNLGDGSKIELNDDATSILAKMFNFMKKSREEDVRLRETDKAFREEKMNEEERRRQEFLKALKQYTNTETATPVEKSESGGLLDLISNIISGLMDTFKTLLDPFRWLLELNWLRGIGSIAKMFSRFIWPLIFNPATLALLAAGLALYGINYLLGKQQLASTAEGALTRLKTGKFPRKDMEEAAVSEVQRKRKEVQEILEKGNDEVIEKQGGRERLQKFLDDTKDIPSIVASRVENVVANSTQAPPRPTDNLQAQIWDSKYKQTHNPDGSPKAVLEPKTPDQQQVPANTATPVSPSSSASTPPTSQTNLSGVDTAMSGTTATAPAVTPVAATPTTASAASAIQENVDLNLKEKMNSAVSTKPIISSQVNNTSKPA